MPDRTPDTAKQVTTKPAVEGSFVQNGHSPQLKTSLLPYHTCLQPKLTVGAPNDPYEQEADQMADRIMRMPDQNFVQRKCGHCEQEEKIQTKPLASFIQRKSNEAGMVAPEAVGSQINASRGGGSNLDKTTQSFMASRFGTDFSGVKIHTGADSIQMNRELGARAFTVGNDIYFNENQYQPGSDGGKHLLVHELTHTLQQGASPTIQRQAVTATAATPPPPRRDVVFIMGSDAFYQTAERFFRARYPQASFVTGLTDFEAILFYLNANFTNPLGNIFIVSHANEDGTLGFALNSSDTDQRMSVVELRNAMHPASGGTSSLTNVAALIDGQTRVQIKGCDLGRNQAIVELIDEAFGGAGVASAPTHEQAYTYSQSETSAGTRAAMDAHISAFEQTLPALPPAPAAIPRGLRGQALTDARAAFRDATEARRLAQAERTAAIAAERTSYTAEAERLGAIAGTHEALSGPMFQRAGSTLFTDTELRPQIDTLYAHLSVAQRASLVTRLVAADTRPAATANSQGVYQQSGQRAYRYTTNFTYAAPQSLAEAVLGFAPIFTRDHFRPVTLDSITPATVGTTTVYNYNFTGKSTETGHVGEDATYSASSAPVEADSVLIAQIQAQINNPEKFAWSVVQTRSASGVITKTVVRERVVAYLHHGSLNASANDYFMPPSTDRRFFAESTFAPPPNPSATP